MHVGAAHLNQAATDATNVLLSAADAANLLLAAADGGVLFRPNRKSSEKHLAGRGLAFRRKRMQALCACKTVHISHRCRTVHVMQHRRQ